MSALLLLEGIAIHVLSRVSPRIMPRLPAAAHALIAGALGLPGLAFFGLLLLLATGALGAA